MAVAESELISVVEDYIRESNLSVSWGHSDSMRERLAERDRVCLRYWNCRQGTANQQDLENFVYGQLEKMHGREKFTEATEVAASKVGLQYLGLTRIERAILFGTIGAFWGNLIVEWLRW